MSIAINLDEKHYTYLSEAPFIPDKLKHPLLFSEKYNSYYVLNIPKEDADKIRDICGEQLQLVGFDEKYELTPEGFILESLIDKLFTG